MPSLNKEADNGNRDTGKRCIRLTEIKIGEGEVKDDTTAYKQANSGKKSSDECR
jgi:hypothetical protein